MVKKNELNKYVAEARSFDQDRLLSVRRSAIVAYIIAALAVISATCSGLAVLYLTPLKEVIPFVIRVDNTTGFVDVVRPLSDAPSTYDTAITKYFATNYIRAREGFSLESASYNFKTVSLMSSIEEQARFAQWYNATNPKGPQITYRNSFVSVTINSFTFLSDNLLQIRFTKEIKDNNNPSSVRKENYIATLNYAYSSAEISDKNRLVNPLGFVVSEYRVNSEALQ